MDSIYINDLEIFACHGVLDAEKEFLQKFVVSVRLYLDLKPAGASDRLTATVNYAQVCDDIEQTMCYKHFNLIEKCAHEIAHCLLMKYPDITKVDVVVKKPWAPIGRSLSAVAVEISRWWHTVFIGIGSNLGDRHGYIDSAVRAMCSDCVRVVKLSSFYETKPVGLVDQGDFINCVAQINTLMTPHELLVFLQNIENQLKRERVVKWGPRTIDLDILLYDDQVLTSAELTIPHPEMHKRKFVLDPLCEIAPNVIHPLFNQMVSQMQV